MDILVNSSGKFVFNGKEYRCALGKGGVRTDKKEGDGATPAGTFKLREVMYRADRILKPETSLPIFELQQNDGWCDDSDNPNYNKKVALPYQASAESLWREDHLYDIIVPLGYNDDPVVPGKGSAIFMHVARAEYTPTDGCVALSLEDLLEVLKSVTPDTKIVIN